MPPQMLTLEKQEKYYSEEQEIESFINGQMSENKVKFSNQEQMKAFCEF